MALSDAYATPQQYRQAIGKQTADDDAQIKQDLEATSRYWDGYLHRPMGFAQDASAVARIYYPRRGRDGKGSHVLLVDDIASTSGLVVKVDTDDDGDFDDEDALTITTDYELHPLNAALGAEAEPWNMIVRKGALGWSLGLRIQVTAIGGWPAVPALVRQLTIEWTAVWRGESVRATARVNELDQVQEVSPFHQSQIKRIAALYRQSRSPALMAGVLT